MGWGGEKEKEKKKVYRCSLFLSENFLWELQPYFGYRQTDVINSR